MIGPSIRRTRRGSALLVAALALSACASQTADTPGATATPTPTASPVPTTPTPTPRATTPTPEPVDPAAIHGAWRAPGTSSSPSTVFLVFDARGEWQATYRLDSGPFDFGTFEFDGRELTLHSSSDATRSPCTGITGTYQPVVSNGGTELRLPAAGASDPCGERLADNAIRRFIKVEL